MTYLMKATSIHSHKEGSGRRLKVNETLLGAVWWRIDGRNAGGIAPQDAVVTTTRESAVELATKILKSLAPELLAAEPFKAGDYVRNKRDFPGRQVYRLIEPFEGSNGGTWWKVAYCDDGQVATGQIQIDMPSRELERVEVKIAEMTTEVWTVIE